MRRRSAQPTRQLASHVVGRRGYTLIEVLVSMLVVAVLLALLVPTIAGVQESGRRVVCQSNLRQLGIGVLMYADLHRGALPPSVYLGSQSSHMGPAHAPEAMPQEMIELRVSPQRDGPSTSTSRGGNDPKSLLVQEEQWDGLGVLYRDELLPAPQVFYCPSHRGEHRFTNYADRWSRGQRGVIVGNFQYRGEGPTSVKQGDGGQKMTRKLFQIDPALTSLLADGFRTRSDYNHVIGVNFFRADLTVHWFSDPGEAVARALPEDSGASPALVRALWRRLDHAFKDGDGSDGVDFDQPSNPPFVH